MDKKKSIQYGYYQFLLMQLLWEYSHLTITCLSRKE
ncbi:hypothetical protein GFC29_3713 [Anoxybacillus sp. B7M1]|nr:hypothetical protein GFC28_1721 [Anoxybacillus sp. B2M1]ANB64494.1 hypothetical protein GFC29_3713 [Anoxybacillus sp. B7M1]MBB3854040.1 hypothetical protein [Parageobacillus caldoxylosilyticus]MBB3907400.1 hypothetical protein [Anoxybacillus rupiensis]